MAAMAVEAGGETLRTNERPPGSRGDYFATTNYEPDADGFLRVVLPERCLYADGVKACSVFIDHYRRRTTGPRFPLAVAGCSTHRQGRYTLYPAGYFPYSRERLAPCMPSGHVVVDYEKGQFPWGTTLFTAAFEASREPGAECDGARPSRRTRDRRLQWAGRLAGVHPDLDDRSREFIAYCLDVPLLSLRIAAQRWAAGATARAAEIIAVLLAIQIDGTVADRLLGAGAIAGLWRPPRRWAPERRCWMVPRSGPLERPRARARRGRSPPPTTLSGGVGAGATRTHSR